MERYYVPFLAILEDYQGSSKDVVVIVVTTNRDDANTHPSLPRPLPGFNSVQVTTVPVAPTATDVSTTITTFMGNIIIHVPAKETVAKKSHMTQNYHE